MNEKQASADRQTASFIRGFADSAAMGHPVSIEMAKQLCDLVKVHGPRIAMALEKCAGQEK